MRNGCFNYMKNTTTKNEFLNSILSNTGSKIVSHTFDNFQKFISRNYDSIIIESKVLIYFYLERWLSELNYTTLFHQEKTLRSITRFDEATSTLKLDSLSTSVKKTFVPIKYKDSLFYIRKYSDDSLTDGNLEQKSVLNNAHQFFSTFEVTTLLEHFQLSPVQALTGLPSIKIIFKKKEENIVNEFLNYIWNKYETPIKTSNALYHNDDNWWNRSSYLSSMNIDSLVLPGDQKERILADVENFFSMSDFYQKRGIPFNRGYMFYGPPGTGKSSFIQAISSYFNLDVYYLSLNSVKDDQSLFSLISSIKPRSILLMEDIDNFAVLNNKTSKRNSLTFSALLNSLSGINSPYGCLFMMTTNHIDKIPSSLLRHGRIDISEEISYCTEDMIHKFWNLFYGFDYDGDLTSLSNITPSQVVEILKTNPFDHTRAKMIFQNKILTVDS